MIGYYQIKSPLSQTGGGHITRFIRQLSEALGEELYPMELDEYISADFALLYVASGGSEGYFLEISGRLGGRRCFILTSGESNSLAASMEILSYLNGHGGTGRIFHGNISEVSSQIRAERNAHRALRSLRGKTLGCIGEPSDWLISSSPDPGAMKKKLGLGFVSVPMEELLSEIALKRYEENEYTTMLKKTPFDRDEVEKALYIYGAFSRIVTRYGLCGVSVRCFDLLDTVRSTGCLGLSILNSLGVYGGCEGDIPSLLSMAVMGEVTGEDTFMCNPSRFDTKEKYAVFAHCAVPLTMPDSFSLDTHFESGIGVAVKGSFKSGECTVFKCSGDLSRHFIKEAGILETEYSDMLCRTQIRVGIDDFRYFLNDPIGNHHIICKGSHAAELEAFFSLLEERDGG